MNTNENKLKGRALINVGIYSAICFVILLTAAMLGMIPIFPLLPSVLVSILVGIPSMLSALHPAGDGDARRPPGRRFTRRQFSIRE